MVWTHQEVCDLAVNWLRRAPGRGGPACNVAFSEARGGWNGEIPDAFGARTVTEDESSVVLEVKVSRADFKSDVLKPHRQPGGGMGVYRYYMCPEGMIGIDELPERWGLIEVSAKGKLTVRAGHVLLPRREQGAWRHERAVEREWLLLATMLSRVGDVEALHRSLKKANLERGRLARQCDVLNDRLRASQRNIENASGTALPRARRKEPETPLA